MKVVMDKRKIKNLLGTLKESGLYCVLNKKHRESPYREFDYCQFCLNKMERRHHL